MDSKDLEYLKRLSNQRRQSHKRNFLYLKDRRYPGWQLVGWMVTEILFVIGTSLPYWARREIINVSFRELGLGRLDVRYGIWVVCVDGIGSTCYNWNKLYKLDPDGVSGKSCMSHSLRITVWRWVAFSWWIIEICRLNILKSTVESCCWMRNFAYFVPFCRHLARVAVSFWELIMYWHRSSESDIGTMIASRLLYRRHFL